MNESINFTAFDLETAQSNRYICQIGIVVVRAGNIVEEKELLIQPPNNKISRHTYSVHGISPKETKHAPLFCDIWEDIKHYFHHQTIVYHGNNNDFDINVLETEIQYYNLTAIRPLSYVNTYKCFDDSHESKSLNNLCTCYNIDMTSHHNALSDAKCCAMLLLKYLNGETPNLRNIIKEQVTRNNNSVYLKDEDRIISSDTKVQDLSIVQNKDTIFYDKKVVISGVFEKYQKRNDLAVLLKGYGADINGSISSKTNIFVFGNDCGPKKMEKVFELNDNGCNIQIIEEKELYKILENIHHG